MDVILLKTMYINRGALLKLIMLAKSIFQFLNKHFYIILIISTISKYTNNKFYKSFTWIIKIFIFANIIFGITYIIYFSVSEHSFVNGIAIYTDLISKYIDNLINLWNDLIKFNIEDSIIKNTSSNSKSGFDLNVQVKEGMRDALKEVIDEALDKIHDEEIQANSNTLKQIALFSSLLFVGYFIFILPGSPISPEELTNFNWFNQGLIEFKLTVKDLIINFFT